MRERYAQTVLTFRIPYVKQSLPPSDNATAVNKYYYKYTKINLQTITRTDSNLKLIAIIIYIFLRIVFV